MNKTRSSVLILSTGLVVFMVTYYSVYLRNSTEGTVTGTYDVFLQDAKPVPSEPAGVLEAFDYAVANSMLDYVESNYKADSISVKNLAILMRIMVRIRLWLQSWVSSGKHEEPRLSDEHGKFLERLQKTEETMYPFLIGKHKTKTVDQWLASYSGRGIVMTGGSNHMRYAVYLLKNLKAVGCELPVEFVTEDVDQLSAEHKTMLVNLGARLIYLNEVVDNNNTQLGGYGMKLAAMFVSTFRETLLLDCDDVFVRSPQRLFDDPGYQASGTLLFYDQPERLNSFEHRDWLKNNLPLPLSRRVLDSNMFRGHAREVDSAAVVMDKMRCFYGLLAATRLNLRRERDALYPVFWGDAELWWIGFEMAAVPYAISPFSAHSIGPQSGNDVCGKNMHVADDGRPLFWNQGFVRTKTENNQLLLHFQAFAPNGIVVVTSSTLYCVKGSGAIPLKQEELQVIEKLENIWNETTGFTHW